MAGTPFTIGADVRCTDGVCGTLSGLVIDPRARTVTHLVVNDRQFQGRLVPVSLVDVDAATGKIGLRCTIAEFGKLGPASTMMPDWSSTPLATSSPTCASRDTCSAARSWRSRPEPSRQLTRTASSSTSPSSR